MSGAEAVMTQHRTMKHTSIILVVGVIFASAFGCTTRRGPDSQLVCGGTLSEKEIAERSHAAAMTEYSWARSWVEQHCPTNAVSVSQRVFVIQETRPRIASIVAHRDGFSLGDVLRQTGVGMGSTRVLRQIGSKDDQQFVTDDAAYEILPLDVVIIARK